MASSSRNVWSCCRYLCHNCRQPLQSSVKQRVNSRHRALQLRYQSSISQSFSRSSQKPGYYPPPEELQQQAYAQLTNRSIIRLHGPDVVDFLNGLLPSRLQPLTTSGTSPTFTAFLSAKGRLLYDVFIYPPADPDAEGPWHLEVHSDSAPAIMSHLKKHKLRSKFKLEKVTTDELGVYYVWPGSSSSATKGSIIGGQDPRPLMGSRYLAPINASSPLDTLLNSGYAASLDEYKIHRMLTGHAEGPTELIGSSALPQESNIDFSQGIDFHKGCYLGQELTIRTHHTGVVRKRILPCQIASEAINADHEVPQYNSSIALPIPPAETNISKVRSTGRAGRSTGKWLGGVGNIGLALCRLEMMTDIELTAEGTTYDANDQFAVIWENGQTDGDGKTTLKEVMIRPFVPTWLRQNIQAGIQARADRGRRKRQEVEDEEIQ